MSPNLTWKTCRLHSAWSPQMAVLQAWERENMSRGMGRWEPPSTHTHTHTHTLLLLPPPPIVCKRAAVQNVFPRPQLCWVVTLRSATTTEREREKERKEKRLIRMNPSHLTSCICRILHHMGRGLCFPRGYDISPAISDCVYTLFIEADQFLLDAAVRRCFVVHPESFLKEITCLHWFYLLLLKILNWELRGNNYFASVWNENIILIWIEVFQQWQFLYG